MHSKTEQIPLVSCFLTHFQRDSPPSLAHAPPGAAFGCLCLLPFGSSSGLISSHPTFICFPVFFCFQATLKTFRFRERLYAEVITCTQHRLVMMVIINNNINQQWGPDLLKMTGRSRRPQSTSQGLVLPFLMELEQLSPGCGRSAQPGPANLFYVSSRICWAGKCFQSC